MGILARIRGVTNFYQNSRNQCHPPPLPPPLAPIRILTQPSVLHTAPVETKENAWIAEIEELDDTLRCMDCKEIFGANSKVTSSSLDGRKVDKSPL